MRKFVLLGYPLGHTMSPPIHERLFLLAMNRDAVYEAAPFPPEEFDEKVKGYLAYDGLNVTIPYKRTIIPYLDQLDETARLYGAVNVVKGGAQTIGYNTDAIGFTRSIQSLGADLSGSVLLLGCGGAGRMMAIETARNGGRLTIAVRLSDLPVAEELKAEIAQIVPHASVAVTTLDAVEGSFDLLANATPVGMYPNIDASPVGEDVVSRCGMVFDAVYNPRYTKLLQTADRLGLPAAGGMSMLVWQAVAAHEIWDGSSYREEDIQSLIREMAERVKQQ